MKAAAIPRAAKSVRKDSADRFTTEHAVLRGSTHIADGPSDGRSVRLTPREHEVLALLCEGLPNKLIGRRLKISSGTVKVHVSNILRALNVSNRLQALLLARCWELTHDFVIHAEQRRPIQRARHR